jgi:hypothetical protein
MGQAVEQRGRHLGVAEDAGPLAEGEVRGDDDGGALVYSVIMFGNARQQDALLRAQAIAGISAGIIAKTLNRTESAVRARANRI